MDGTDGFKTLAAHILAKAIPHALQAGGSEDALVEALLPLVQEATEAWFDPGSGKGMIVAAREFIKRARENWEENAEEVEI